MSSQPVVAYQARVVDKQEVTAKAEVPAEEQVPRDARLGSVTIEHFGRTICRKERAKAVDMLILPASLQDMRMLRSNPINSQTRAFSDLTFS